MQTLSVKDAIYQVTNDVQKLEQVMEYYGVLDDGKGKRLCPFHNDHEPSLAIQKSKAKYKCFVCKAYGDIIDFVCHQENADTVTALKKVIEILGLGIKIEKDELDELDEYLRSKNKTWWKDDKFLLEDIYYYKNEQGEPILCKLKFKDPDTGKKQFLQYVVKRNENGKLFADYTDKEKKYVLYNLQGVKLAKEKGYYVFFVEGEKDADNLRSIGLIATTLNTINMISRETLAELAYSRVVVLRDNDKVGFEYEERVRKALINIVKEYRVPLIREIHGSKCDSKGDISDFIEMKRNQGYANKEIREQLLDRVKRSLDLKNKYELQQDWRGVYKTIFKYDKDGELVGEEPMHLTDFNVSHINVLEQKDNGDQEIELHIITEHGAKKCIRGRVNDLFLDAKSFAKHCKMDFNYKPSAGKYFIDFKQWLNRYFLLDLEEEYSTIGVRKIDDEYVFITNDGVMKKDGELHKDYKCNGSISQIKYEGMNKLTTDTAKELQEHLFKFNSPTNCYNLLGSIGAHMLNGVYRDTKGKNVHVLCAFGESGAGKSFTLQNVIIPLLGLNTSALGFSGLTQYTISKNVATSFLPTVIDEVKPSKAPIHKMHVLSNLIRNITEDYVDYRGTKDQKVNSFRYNSSLIIAGEEGIEETAVKNRSNTVWFHVKDLNKDTLKHGSYFTTTEGEEALRALGRAIYTNIIRNYNSDVLIEKLTNIENEFVVCSELDPRVRRTFCNTMLGYRLIKETLMLYTNSEEGFISDFEVSMLIYDNIFNNVLEEAVRVRQDYEDLFEVISELASRDAGIDKFAIVENVHYRLDSGKLCLHLPSLFDILDMYYRSKGKQTPMSPKAFAKQTAQSEYIVDADKKKHYKAVSFKGKNKKCYIYDTKKLSSLSMEFLAPKVEDTLTEADAPSWEQI